MVTRETRAYREMRYPNVTWRILCLLICRWTLHSAITPGTFF